MAQGLEKKTDELQEGMVLSQDLLGQNGLVLLPKGSKLTEDTISWLKRLDVRSIWVKEGQRLTDSERESIEKELERRFSRVKGNAFMEEVRKCVFSFLTGEDNGTH